MLTAFEVKDFEHLQILKAREITDFFYSPNFIVNGINIALCHVNK